MGRVTVAGGRPAMEVPETGLKLADIAEGQIVKVNENGSPVEFYVAKHNYESGLNGAGRTLLVRKECHSKRVWDTDGGISWPTSALDTWLNGTYKGFLDSGCRAAISTTKFRVATSRTNAAIGTTERSVFLLAASEVADIASSSIYCPVETVGKLSTSSVLRSAYYQGVLTGWWTRTVNTNPDKDLATYVMTRDETWGATNGNLVTASLAVRPCFTLPATVEFDEETLILKGVS